MADGKSYSIDFDGERLLNSLSIQTLHIILTVFGSLLVATGIVLTIGRFFYVKKVEKKRRVEILRFRDDAIIEPRMCVKVAEIGLKQQMHWKEFFTRDSMPFDYPPKENNQPSNSTRTDMSEYVDAASTSSMVQLTEDAVEEVMRRVVKVSTIGEVVKTTRVNSFVRDSILRVMKNNTNLDLKLKWLNNGSMDRKPGFVIQGTELKSLEDAISCVRFILKHSRRIETVTISMGVPDASLLDALVTVLIDAENVRLRELHMHRSYTSRSFLIISKLIEKNAASLKVIGKIGLSEACACMDSRINLERFSLHNFDLVKHGALESDALSAETTLCIEKLGSSGAVFKHLSYTTHSGFDLSKSVTTSMLVACKVESLRLTMSKGAPIPRRAHPNCSVQNLITLELIGDLITPDVSELFPNLKHFYFQRQDLIHGTKN